MRPKTVQNRSRQPAEQQFMPSVLPADFPIAMGRRHSPSTEPITGLHLHDCLELGYCHQGAGIFVVEDKVLPFASGDVSVINDREMHRAQSAPDTGSSWSFVMLDPAKLLSAASDDREALRIAPLGGPGFPNIVKPGAHPELVGAVRQLVAELEAAGGGARPGHRTVVRGLVLAAMGLLQRLPGAEPDATPRERAGPAEAIAPALEHLSRTYAEPVGMAELAELCATSESNLRRMFHRATGRSPRDYLTYLRLQMATTLLESTSLRVLDVAGRVGYPTLSSFNRHFQRVMKCSPRQWRGRRRPPA
mgnify:CR=1 FL=1